jgi:hypothetical protein
MASVVHLVRDGDLGLAAGPQSEQGSVLEGLPHGSNFLKSDFFSGQLSKY